MSELNYDEQLAALQEAVKTNGGVSAEEFQVHYPLLSLDEIKAVKQCAPIVEGPEVQTVEAPVMVVAPEVEPEPVVEPVEKEGD